MSSSIGETVPESRARVAERRDVLRFDAREVDGAGYGDRTRLTGLGSQDITTMLSPRLMSGWSQPDACSYRCSATILAHPRISASTSSRLVPIVSGVLASRFSRSNGSVFDGRTLKCQ